MWPPFAIEICSLYHSRAHGLILGGVHAASHFLRFRCLLYSNVLFYCRCPVCPILPISLDCPLLIASLTFIIFSMIDFYLKGTT